MEKSFVEQVMLKAKNQFLPAQPTAAESVGDVYVSPSMREQGVLKAYIPRFLYRPPFGYPRTDNVPLIRQLAKNPYVFSITKTIADEVAYNEYDIVFKESSKEKDNPAMEELRLKIKKFFANPNSNKESWATLRSQAVTDILEVDAGVFVKVFNRKKEFCQLFARDGGSFLVNTDIYGYLGNRADYVEPLPTSWQIGYDNATPDLVKNYGFEYAERAAYFQYGTAVSAAIPVPFGKREIVYMMMSSRTDQPYGRSPIAILADIILTLVYGANFNLDYYMNNNMPEGILSIIGANAEDIQRFRSRMEATFKTTDEATGFPRRVAYRVPITSQEAKFTPFQLDPKTMQILEQQKWFYNLVLACYGIPPDEMGITENSNRAVGESQFRVYLRKSARPIMQKMKDHIDQEIIAEFGQEAYENLEYKWIEYDIDHELKRRDLYQKEIALGVKTPEMIAKDLDINYEDVMESQKKVTAHQQSLMPQQPDGQTGNGQPGNPSQPAQQGEQKPKEDGGQQPADPMESALNDFKTALAGTKSVPETELEKQLREQIEGQGKKILDALNAIPV